MAHVPESGGSARLTPAQLLAGLDADARSVAAASALAVADPIEAEELAVELIGSALRPTRGPADDRPNPPPTIRWPGSARRHARLYASADRALGRLAARWESVPQELRGLAGAVGVGRWSDAARAACATGQEQDRLGVCALAADLAEPALVRTLASLLADESARVRERAEHALLNVLARHAPSVRIALGWTHAEADWSLGPDHADPLMGPSADPPTSPAVRQLLLRALHDAMLTIDAHRSRPLVLSALAMCRWRSRDPEDVRLWSALSSPDAPAHRALRAVLRGTTSAIDRARAWEWAADPTMAPLARERLSHANSAAEHAAMFERWHLALRPARARALAEVEAKVVRSLERPAAAGAPGEGVVALAPGGILPADADLRALRPRAHRGVPLIARIVRADDRARRAAIEPLLSSPDARARHAGMRASAVRDLSDFLADPDPGIARGAMLRCSVLGTPRPGEGVLAHRAGVARAAARSPSSAVRRLGAQERTLLDPLGASGDHARIVARRALASDPPGVLRALRAAIEGEDEPRAAAACARARELRLAPALATALIGRADGATRALAAAVAALRGVDPRAEPAALPWCVARCANSDPRVRAGAIETLAHWRDRRMIEALPAAALELKGDPHHRVRANRALALVEPKPGASHEREPAGVLLELLASDDAMARRAGAWASARALRRVGSTRGLRAPSDAWAMIAARLGTLAHDDADAGVRARASMALPALALLAPTGSLRRSMGGHA